MDEFASQLVGLWQVVGGLIENRLELRPDGSFTRGFVVLVGSYWGNWDVEFQGPQPWLVLRLQGSQPVFNPVLFGVQPSSPPAIQTMQLLNIQPNEVDFVGGALLRVVPIQPTPPWTPAPIEPPQTQTPPSQWPAVDSAKPPPVIPTPQPITAESEPFKTPPVINSNQHASEGFALMQRFIDNSGGAPEPESAAPPSAPPQGAPHLTTTATPQPLRIKASAPGVAPGTRPTTDLQT